MDQFGECLFRRTDQINARSYKNEGVTVLQHALLMDYEKKELLINLEDYYGQRDLSPRNDPNKDDSEDAEDCEEHAAFRSRRR